MIPARPPFIRAQDWARMSWHQRQRAARAATAAAREQVRAEKHTLPPVPAEPAPTDARNAIRMICAILDRELTAAHQENLAAGQRGRYAPCGTQAAYRRHLRHGEPIDQECRDARNAVARDYYHRTQGEAA